MKVFVYVVFVPLVGFKRNSSLLEIYSFFSWGLNSKGQSQTSIAADIRLLFFNSFRSSILLPGFDYASPCFL